MAPKKRKSKQEDNDEVSTDEEKAIKNKRSRVVSSKSEDTELKFDLKWEEFGQSTGDDPKLKPLYYLYSKTVKHNEKIASFDIDMTIIKTKSGKTFPINNDDWTWFDKCVPAKLKELDQSGFRVVFFTNQGGIEKKKVKLAELKSKFEKMVFELDIPVFIFIATGENHMRKPSTGMWEFLLENCNSSIKINMDESFYVGDAAGRPKDWAPGRKKDFSCADRMFAHNINLKFQTPEEFFLSYKKSNFEWGSIDPLSVLTKSKSINSTDKKYHSEEQEVILLIGPPASGKSTFSKKHFIPNGYIHINRDTLKTQEKCLKETELALKSGKKVVIDNTNPSKKARAEFISLAKKNKIGNIRAFVLKTPIELCHHLNYVRQNQTQGKVRRIPDVGYHTYNKHFEAPDKSEGFTDIVNIDFEPNFESDLHEKLFKQWTN